MRDRLLVLVQALRAGVLVDAVARRLYVGYASALPFSISPCTSLAQLQAGTCGVVATDSLVSGPHACPCHCTVKKKNYTERAMPSSPEQQH